MAAPLEPNREELVDLGECFSLRVASGEFKVSLEYEMAMKIHCDSIEAHR